MAAVSGINGAFSFAGSADLASGQANAILASRWSATLAMDSHDVTPFNPTADARVHLGGLHSLSGTASGFFDSATAHDHSYMEEDSGAVAAIVLTALTGKTYSFNGLVTDWSVDTDVQGIVTWSLSFVSSGQVSIG